MEFQTRNLCTYVSAQGWFGFILPHLQTFHLYLILLLQHGDEGKLSAAFAAEMQKLPNARWFSFSCFILVYELMMISTPVFHYYLRKKMEEIKPRHYRLVMFFASLNLFLGCYACEIFKIGKSILMWQVLVWVGRPSHQPNWNAKSYTNNVSAYGVNCSYNVKILKGSIGVSPCCSYVIEPNLFSSNMQWFHVYLSDGDVFQHMLEVSDEWHLVWSALLHIFILLEVLTFFAHML